MSSKPLPDLDDGVAAPYWAGAARHELVLPWCDHCDQVFFPPRLMCPQCWQRDINWRQVSGTGTVWTFTEVHVAFYDDTWAVDVPYVVAVVELEEGPRLLTNLIDADPEALSIGDPVELEFIERAESVTLPVFRVSR